ncbi:MAG: hypothetical protein KIB43_08110 [Clostridium baratii]|uniref:hypothetical protein n=1 Tax=Clostridium baratii TaxID=1561 RepID=UPI002431776E|nr:hypothetical protein [Clostridium baratii]MBS6006912.1 hypothetical protein [Clostridium baratii]
MSKITIEDVKEFIREYGYIYGLEIEEELEKVKKQGISKKAIDEELKKNYKLYRELADM